VQDSARHASVWSLDRLRAVGFIPEVQIVRPSITPGVVLLTSPGGNVVLGVVDSVSSGTGLEIVWENLSLSCSQVEKVSFAEFAIAIGGNVSGYMHQSGRVAVLDIIK